MEAATDWILTNQQIPESLPGAALWRHTALRSGVAISPYDVTQQAHDSLHVVLVIQIRSQLHKQTKNQICLEHPKHTFALRFLFL